MANKHSKPFFTGSIFFWSLGFGGVFALFAAFTYLVFNFQFASIGQVAVPLVAAFFGFSSLLFNKARAYSKGRSRTRALYAAERALQAALFGLAGLLVGAAMYGLFVWFGFAPGQPISKKHGLLFLFFFPYALIQTGYACFMIALRIAGKEYLYSITPLKLRRRIDDGL